MNFVNNDTSTPVIGDIVRSSGQNFGAVLAQADSAAHSKGLLGVWDSTPGQGASGAIKSSDIVEVNCTESVVPGDTLYLSAATAGKATKTSPEIQIVIGNVIAVRLLDSVYKATVYWEGVKSELTGTQTSIVDSIAELDPDEVPALDSDGTVYAANLDNIPDSTAGAGRKAVTSTEKAAVAALAPKKDQLVAVANSWQSQIELMASLYAVGTSEVITFRTGIFPTGQNVLGAGVVESAQLGGPLVSQPGYWAKWTSKILPANGAWEVPWLVAFDIKVPLLTGESYVQFGLYEESDGHNIKMAHVPGADATHWLVIANNGSDGTITVGPEVDGQRHTICLAWDMTTTRMLLDGSPVVEHTGPLNRTPADALRIATSAGAMSEPKIYHIGFAV